MNNTTEHPPQPLHHTPQFRYQPRFHYSTKQCTGNRQKSKSYHCSTTAVRSIVHREHEVCSTHRAHFSTLGSASRSWCVRDGLIPQILGRVRGVSALSLSARWYAGSSSTVCSARGGVDVAAIQVTDVSSREMGSTRGLRGGDDQAAKEELEHFRIMVRHIASARGVQYDVAGGVGQRYQDRATDDGTNHKLDCGQCDYSWCPMTWQLVHRMSQIVYDLSPRAPEVIQYADDVALMALLLRHEAPDDDLLADITVKLAVSASAVRQPQHAQHGNMQHPMASTWCDSVAPYSGYMYPIHGGTEKSLRNEQPRAGQDNQASQVGYYPRTLTRPLGWIPTHLDKREHINFHNLSKLFKEVVCNSASLVFSENASFQARNKLHGATYTARLEQHNEQVACGDHEQMIGNQQQDMPVSVSLPRKVVGARGGGGVRSVGMDPAGCFGNQLGPADGPSVPHIQLHTFNLSDQQLCDILALGFGCGVVAGTLRPIAWQVTRRMPSMSARHLYYVLMGLTAWNAPHSGRVATVWRDNLLLGVSEWLRARMSEGEKTSVNDVALVARGLAGLTPKYDKLIAQAAQFVASHSAAASPHAITAVVCAASTTQYCHNYTLFQSFTQLAQNSSTYDIEHLSGLSWALGTMFNTQKIIPEGSQHQTSMSVMRSFNHVLMTVVQSKGHARQPIKPERCAVNILWNYGNNSQFQSAYVGRLVHSMSASCYQLTAGELRLVSQALSSIRFLDKQTLGLISDRILSLVQSYQATLPQDDGGCRDRESGTIESAGVQDGQPKSVPKITYTDVVDCLYCFAKFSYVENVNVPAIGSSIFLFERELSTDLDYLSKAVWSLAALEVLNNPDSHLQIQVKNLIRNINQSQLSHENLAQLFNAQLYVSLLYWEMSVRVQDPDDKSGQSYIFPPPQENIFRLKYNSKEAILPIALFGRGLAKATREASQWRVSAVHQTVYSSLYRTFNIKNLKQRVLSVDGLLYIDFTFPGLHGYLFAVEIDEPTMWTVNQPRRPMFEAQQRTRLLSAVGYAVCRLLRERWSSKGGGGMNSEYITGQLVQAKQSQRVRYDGIRSMQLSNKRRQLW